MSNNGGKPTANRQRIYITTAALVHKNAARRRFDSHLTTQTLLRYKAQVQHSRSTHNTEATKT